MRIRSLLLLALLLFTSRGGSAAAPSTRRADSRPALSAPSAPSALRAASATPPQQYADSALVETFAAADRKAKLAAAFPALDAHLSAQLAAQKLPGLVLGVIIDGDLAYAKGFGFADLATRAPATADTIYRIGSITKTFTSLAVAKLRDEGKLSLDDPAARFVPELGAIRYPTRDSAPFTLRHILTHTSGLPPVAGFSFTQSDHDVTRAELLSGIDRITLATAPGTAEVYSNFGMALLGLVIERVTGVAYRDYVSREIFAPLGMSASYWAEADVPRGRLATAYVPGPSGSQKVPHWRLGASEAAGGIYTSLRDLARYAAFQLAAYPPRSEPESGPVRRSTVREAHAVQHHSGLTVTVRGPEADVSATASGLGLAWWSDETCELEQLVWHPGETEGYTAAIHLLPQRGVGLVLLTNSFTAKHRAITERALAILRESGGLTRRTLPVPPAVAQAMARVAALYTSYSDKAYGELFSKTLRDAVPSAQVAELTRRLTRLHGACKDPVPLAVLSASSARFKLPCERGFLEYELTIDAAEKLLAASVESRSLPPSAAMTVAATRIASLLKAWDERIYTALLSPALPQAALKSRFRELAQQHGSCALARPIDGDGESTASLALSCERGGDLLLELTLDDAGTRAKSMTLAPLSRSRAEGQCAER